MTDIDGRVRYISSSSSPNRLYSSPSAKSSLTYPTRSTH